MVSPIRGHPIWPGGRLRDGFFLLVKMKVMTIRARMEERKQKVRCESDMELACLILSTFFSSDSLSLCIGNKKEKRNKRKLHVQWATG